MLLLGSLAGMRCWRFMAREELPGVASAASSQLPHPCFAPPAPVCPPQEMEAISGTKGCAYCGGLGHRVTDCPTLRADSKEQTRKQQDRFGGGGGGFGAEM